MSRQERISLAGQALQGILERDTGWGSKLADDILYKRVASYCVSLADSILEKIDEGDSSQKEHLEEIVLKYADEGNKSYSEASRGDDECISNYWLGFLHCANSILKEINGK